MDLINRIGEYFTEQEIQMQNAIDFAIESSKNIYEDDEESTRQLQRAKSQDKLQRVDLVETKRQRSETKKVKSSFNNTIDDANRELLAMYDTEQPQVDALYEKTVDAEASLNLVKKSKKSVKKKKKKKKQKKSEAAALALQKAMQIERQKKHAEAFRAVQERAKQIQAEKLRERQERMKREEEERLRIEKQLEKIDKVRQQRFNKRLTEVSPIRSPRIDPKTKFGPPPVQDNQSEEPTTEEQVKQSIFLERLARQQHDELVFKIRLREKRFLDEKNQAELKAAADLNRRIREKEIAAAEKRQRENDQTLQRLEQLRADKEALEESLNAIQAESNEISRNRYDLSKTRTEIRFEEKQTHMRLIKDNAVLSRACWVQDEREKLKEIQLAREKAKERLKLKSLQEDKVAIIEETETISKEDLDFLTTELEDVQVPVRESLDLVRKLDDDELFTYSSDEGSLYLSSCDSEEDR